MKYWTWAEIRNKIEQECDLEDETFITRDELLSYANEAIDEAEAEIHGLYEDYFLSKATINVASGDESISIPDNIPLMYAHKIRRILFKTEAAQTAYTVQRAKDWHKFEAKALADAYQTTELYQYFIDNTTSGDPRLVLAPRSSVSGVLTIWYLRNANTLSSDTDICDIPEFINFIFWHMKMKIYGKEGHPGYQDALERLETERQRMTAVLASQVPDADNYIELDMSYYNDMN